MRDYVTVSNTGILLRATKIIAFVPFFLFLEIRLRVVQITFTNSFFQRCLVSFSLYCIRSLHCSMYHVYGSINVLTRYQGKGPYSTCVAMLCVAIGMFGAKLFT